MNLIDDDNEGYLGLEYEQFEEYYFFVKTINIKNDNVN